MSSEKGSLPAAEGSLNPALISTMGRRCISYTVQWGSTVRGKNTLFSTGYSGRKGSNGACSIQKGVGFLALFDSTGSTLSQVNPCTEKGKSFSLRLL
ncbi:hypothetical protein HZH66_008451 [Vespula vulgaris]|uniref:Uncharacterized protein n=1 Tax=Vespula vulgaris TaxID=7454 RepID=A0A834JPW0_VESVU|nr:hypothetical protein HZH66_008451 [Vespula vulgaris]